MSFHYLRPIVDYLLYTIYKQEAYLTDM